MNYTQFCIVILTISTFSSCILNIDVDDCDQDSTCINYFIDKYDMVEYCDQTLDCEEFLERWEFQNQEYFVLNDHCSDRFPEPFDCDDNQLFDGPNDELSQLFLAQARFIEIVAYKP